MTETNSQFARYFEDYGWIGAVIQAAVIIVITAVVVHIATLIIRRLLTRNDSVLPASTIFVNIVRVVLWFIGLAFLLRVCFHYDINGLIAGLGVAGIAVSLGLQDTIKNVFGGLQVSLMGLATPGDILCVNNSQVGQVTDVTWRQTTLVTPTGAQIIVPNALMASTAIERLPESQSVCVHVVVPTDACTDENIARIEDAAQAAMGEYAFPGKRGWLRLNEMTSSGVAGDLVVYVKRANLLEQTYTDLALRAVLPLLDELTYTYAIKVQQ